MHWIQELVNAQLSVNRAVFEANAPGRTKGAKPRPDYIMTCITDAINELNNAKDELTIELKNKID